MIESRVEDLYVRHGYREPNVEVVRYLGEEPDQAYLEVQIEPGRQLEIVRMLTAFFLSDAGGWQQIVLLFTMAIELLFLGMVPRNERFRRAVRSRKAAEQSKPPTEKEVFRLLSKQNQKRYIRLRNLEKSIEANYQKIGYASQGMLESHIQKLDGLLDSYLRLLQSQERYERFSQESTKNEVARAIQDLRKEMETDSPRVRAIKQRRLGILERRLEKFKRANENLEIIEAQLETIEDVTKYIHEQSMTMRNPEEITFQLDTLLTEVEETQASVLEIEDVFSTAGPTGIDLLEDIDTYEAEDPSDLPASRTRVQE